MIENRVHHMSLENYLCKRKLAVNEALSEKFQLAERYNFSFLVVGAGRHMSGHFGGTDIHELRAEFQESYKPKQEMYQYLISSCNRMNLQEVNAVVQEGFEFIHNMFYEDNPTLVLDQDDLKILAFLQNVGVNLIEHQIHVFQEKRLEIDICIAELEKNLSVKNMIEKNIELIKLQMKEVEDKNDQVALADEIMKEPKKCYYVSSDVSKKQKEVSTLDLNIAKLEKYLTNNDYTWYLKDNMTRVRALIKQIKDNDIIASFLWDVVIDY